MRGDGGQAKEAGLIQPLPLRLKAQLFNQLGQFIQREFSAFSGDGDERGFDHARAEGAVFHHRCGRHQMAHSGGAEDLHSSSVVVLVQIVLPPKRAGMKRLS